MGIDWTLSYFEPEGQSGRLKLEEQNAQLTSLLDKKQVVYAGTLQEIR